MFTFYFFYTARVVGYGPSKFTHTHMIYFKLICLNYMDIA